MIDTYSRVWLSNDDLAARYSVSVSTIRQWRAAATGPAGRRFGRHIRYSEADVIAWEDERATADRSPAA